MPADGERLSLFLGGSIEMGQAENWQARLIAQLRGRHVPALDIFNPRRPDWDASWPNDPDFPPFREQVDWEMRAQKRADILIYYFAAHTLSPITLFELGLFHGRRPVVGIDPAYARAGNLLVTRDHFPLDIFIGWEVFIKAIFLRLDSAGFAGQS